MVRVLIISMPWCAVSRPNLSAGLLKALAARSSSSCDILDASLFLAAEIGGSSYETLAETPGLFGICEHVFAVDLFGREALQSNTYLAKHGFDNTTGPFIRLRDEIIPRFLDDLTARVSSGRYDIVGFTCTFNQVFASLALAQRLKAVKPCLRTILGGACVHGSMGEEYARAFPELIDNVFLGEADESFPAFIRTADSQGDFAAIPGITANGRPTTGKPIPMQRMELVPMPDYDDFFALRDELIQKGNELPDVVTLPFEGARGCWWGAKQHCTFCGLNNLGMDFRSKASTTVAAEVDQLAKKYGILRFMAADNIITHQGFDALMSELTNLDGDYRFFYEVKANLKRDEVAKLATSGIRWVQPGIEAFSDGLLTLMRKGTTALQNVCLLRLCTEYGITPSYNILSGFPGETDEDYEEMLTVMGRITHLPPPSGNPCLVQIHRFSPFYSKMDEYDFRNVRPAGYYQHLVPEDRADLSRIAYFFDRDLPEESVYARYSACLRDAVTKWHAEPAWAVVRLGPGFGELEIGASGVGPVNTYGLSLSEVTLLILSDRPVHSEKLLISAGTRLNIEPNELRKAMARLSDFGALLTNRGRSVSTIPYEQPRSSQQLAAWLERWTQARGLVSCSQTS